MSEPEPSLRADQTADTPSAVSVYALWLVAQGLALILAWADFHLTARSAQGTHPLAGQMMILTQIIVSSLTVTMLTRTWRSSAVVAAMAFPFSAIAATTAGVNPLVAFKSFGLLLAWLTGLTALNALGRRIRFLPREAVPIIVNLWIWGTLIGYYLIADFHPDSPARQWLARLCPLMWPW